MCKEMLVIMVKKGVYPKRTIGKMQGKKRLGFESHWSIQLYQSSLSMNRVTR
jgi:hypothetical protein